MPRLLPVAGLLLLSGVLTQAAPPPAAPVQLAWEVPAVPSQLEDAWGLYRQEPPGAYQLLALLDPTTFGYTDQAVRKHTTYCYTITARRGSDESPPSHEACARVR